jgi:hypothetical protein
MIVVILEEEKKEKKIVFLNVNVIYTVSLLSFRTECAERILRAPSGGHPQKHVGASLDTLCA